MNCIIINKFIARPLTRDFSLREHCIKISSSFHSEKLTGVKLNHRKIIEEINVPQDYLCVLQGLEILSHPLFFHQLF